MGLKSVMPGLSEPVESVMTRVSHYMLYQSNQSILYVVSVMMGLIMQTMHNIQ
jgi:hypothetical protein